LEVKSKQIEIACADAHNEKSWGRIQGKTVFGWLADEITQHPKNFVVMAQQRCRGDGQVWPKFWTCNPDVPTHFVRTEYIQNEKLDIATWHFVLTDNPVLSGQYIQELKSSHSGVFFDRYILGKWVLAEGTVYDEFQDTVHIVEPFDIPKEWQRIRAIDYGYTNPFVCLWGAVDEDGRLYIYDEYYRRQRLIKDHAEEIKKREGNFTVTVADHDAQDNAEMKSHGVYTKRASKEVVVGIQKVKARLKVQGDGRPRLYVFNTCKNLIREFTTYRWNESREGKEEKEEPMKIDDHTMDALRYMVMALDKRSGKVADFSIEELGL
jgi:phage terminase large subunit